MPRPKTIGAIESVGYNRPSETGQKGWRQTFTHRVESSRDCRPTCRHPLEAAGAERPLTGPRTSGTLSPRERAVVLHLCPLPGERVASGASQVRGLCPDSSSTKECTLCKLSNFCCLSGSLDERHSHRGPFPVTPVASYIVFHVSAPGLPKLANDSSAERSPTQREHWRPCFHR